MTEKTPLWVANYGECTCLAIIGVGIHSYYNSAYIEVSMFDEDEPIKAICSL